MLEKLVVRLSEEFEVIVYSHTPPNEDYANDHLHMKYPSRSVRSGKIRWLYLLYFFFQDYRKEKFSVLLSFWGYPTGFFAVCIQKLLGVPSVVSVLGADSASIKSIDYGIFHKRFPRWISTWAYLKASVLLALSEFQKNKLVGFGITRDIRVIPWGADSSMYSFRQKPRHSTLNVIHVSHINPVKDQPTLLKAFALIVQKQPARLKIFGLDCMEGSMQRLCVELGIENLVEFAGMVPYHEMPQHYHEADIMLHTSWSEAQCMALTEAAACGVLLAGTKVGFLHDLGEEGGITIDVGDYENLATKVLNVLNNPVEWNRKTENAKHWSQMHTFDWTVKELTAILQNL